MALNKTITAIIIDDDEEAIALLEIYLKAFREIEIVDKTTKPKQGIKQLIRKMPDLVFLDIDMPEVNGLEVADVIKDNQLSTEIVFTTAHSKYAFKSLNVQPLDYLVKPFGPEQLISVINRYKTRIKRKELERSMDIFIRNNRPVKKVKLTTKSGIVFIDPKEIMLIQAKANYSIIHLSNGNLELITQLMQKVVELIDFQNLVKINRSAFINLQYLRKIDRRRKICMISHNNVEIEEPINRSSITFFEKLNCFSIT